MHTVHEYRLEKNQRRQNHAVETVHQWAESPQFVNTEIADFYWGKQKRKNNKKLWYFWPAWVSAHLAWAYRVV